MTSRIDDWEKTRFNGKHLTPEEVGIIRKGFKEGRDVRAIARELKCASRTVTRYYELFMAEGVSRKKAGPTVPRPSRFYRSNFEPS